MSIEISPGTVNNLPESNLGFGKTEEKRESVRGNIVYSLLCIFAGTIVLSLTFVLGEILLILFLTNLRTNTDINTKCNDSRAKDFLTLIITSEVGLMGAAMGYYFGEKK